jgi:hypothetical protein
LRHAIAGQIVTFLTFLTPQIPHVGLQHDSPLSLLHNFFGPHASKFFGLRQNPFKQSFFGGQSFCVHGIAQSVFVLQAKSVPRKLFVAATTSCDETPWKMTNSVSNNEIFIVI